MASKWTDEQQKHLAKTFTIKGRMLFPNLLTARAKEAGKRETYDAQLTWLPQENAQVMNELNGWLHFAVPMFHQGCNPQALVSPIKDFNTYQRQDAKANPEYLRGQLWVNASTGKDYPPQVVKQIPNMPAGQNLIKMTANDEAEVYSGRNVVFNISFYPMVPQPGSTNQKRGFSVNVNAVLLQEGGEKVGGAPSVDVGQVFGGFAQDMGMAPQFGAPAAFNHAPAPQAAPQYAPQAAPQYAPQAAPQYAPQLPPLGQPAPAPQYAPQAAPQYAPQANPAQPPAWPPAAPQTQQQQPQFAPNYNPNAPYNGSY